jgi:hypothetical protein
MGMFVTLGIRLLEFMFAVGMIGSVVVLILTGIEDIEILLGFDDSGSGGG